MKRLGKFTGKIYDDYDFSKCPECCVLLSDKEAMDEQFIREHHARDLQHCVQCFGCPAAQS